MSRPADCFKRSTSGLYLGFGRYAKWDFRGLTFLAIRISHNVARLNMGRQGPRPSQSGTFAADLSAAGTRP